MLARRIPDVMSLGPPASAEQIDALAALLGLLMEYRALLMESDGVSASLVQVFAAEEVPERNATYEVAKYAPGYILIGTVWDFPVLLQSGRSSPVYQNDWGAMTPDCMSELAPSLSAWIERGAPTHAIDEMHDREGLRPNGRSIPICWARGSAVDAGYEPVGRHRAWHGSPLAGPH